MSQISCGTLGGAWFTWKSHFYTFCGLVSPSNEILGVEPFGLKLLKEVFTNTIYTRLILLFHKLSFKVISSFRGCYFAKATTIFTLFGAIWYGCLAKTLSIFVVLCLTLNNFTSTLCNYASSPNPCRNLLLGLRTCVCDWVLILLEIPLSTRHCGKPKCAWELRLSLCW
jgi:hypothetical protein